MKRLKQMENENKKLKERLEEVRTEESFYAFLY